MSLSEFDVTPSPTNSLSDEGGEEEEGAHSPDHIQMDVEFPRAQLEDYPVGQQIQAESASAAIPFPPTPENSEVSEPTPLIQPNSYKDIKDSLYFQERMVKTKKTRKLTKRGRRSCKGGKQPRQPIPATPVRKTGIGNKAARNEVGNTISAGQKAPRRIVPATGGVKKPHRYRPGRWLFVRSANTKNQWNCYAESCPCLASFGRSLMISRLTFGSKLVPLGPYMKPWRRIWWASSRTQTCARFTPGASQSCPRTCNWPEEFGANGHKRPRGRTVRQQPCIATSRSP